MITKPDEAHNFVNQALAIEPWNFIANWTAANLAQLNNDFEAALKYARVAHFIAPSAASSQFIDNIEISSGKNDGINDIKAFLNTSGNAAIVGNNLHLSKSSYFAGDLLYALEVTDTVLTAYPDDIDSLLLKIQILTDLDKLTKAKQVLDHAERIIGKKASATYHAGLLEKQIFFLIANNDLTSAQEKIDELKKDYPGTAGKITYLQTLLDYQVLKTSLKTPSASDWTAMILKLENLDERMPNRWSILERLADAYAERALLGNAHEKYNDLCRAANIYKILMTSFPNRAENYASELEKTNHLLSELPLPTLPFMPVSGQDSWLTY